MHCHGLLHLRPAETWIPAHAARNAQYEAKLSHGHWEGFLRLVPFPEIVIQTLYEVPRELPYAPSNAVQAPAPAQHH